MSDIEFKKLAREMAGKQNNGSSVLLLSIVTLISIIGIWAAATELDNVVRGSGKTVSEAQNQLVQSSEAGVIRTRYVNAGDIVTKGQLLFDIDPVDAKTQLDQAEKRLSSLQIKTNRLLAEVAGEQPKFDDDLIMESPEAVSTELALFKARLEDLNTNSAIIQQRRLQKLNEIDELSIQRTTAENNLTLIQKEIATIEPLVKAGLAPETRLITLQRDQETNQGAIKSSRAAAKRIEAGLTELDQELIAAKQTYVTRALTDLSKIESELAEVKARIPALSRRVERTTVKSPVDGIVNQVNFETTDAYVRTGEVLVEIVPTGSDLIVETRIDPKDIADIAIGQDVKISLTAYDPSRYGRIDGSVVGISADALTDDQTGEQYYLVDVAINGTLFEDDGAEVSILPGMVASIDVLSGKRTVLDYFWQPIAKTKDKALRD